VGRIRELSTKRLIASSAGLLAAVAGGTTIALAAGGGPTPPPRPLDKAIDHALAGPSVAGVTARIRFTNHLIDSSGVEGVDPILKGASGRLWASADGRLRLELQADDGGRGDAIAAIDGNRFSLYDPATNTVYRGNLPQKKEARPAHDASDGPPSLARIDNALAKLSEHASLSGARPSRVGGQPAYTVKAAPKRSGGLLGGIDLGWDSSRAVPLKAAVYAKGSTDPVLELEATRISYGSVPSSDLALPNPPGAKVVDLGAKTARYPHGKRKRERPVEGVASVRAALPFELKAPSALAGRPRTGVKLIGSGGQPAALITYGRDLGGIAVIESRAKPGQAASSQSGHHRGRELSLPKVSVNGRSGQRLETALGSVVRFDRAGVSYVVLGSVRPATALAAARGL